MRSTCAVVSCITRLLSCHVMPYPVMSCPVLLCSVLFTPAPSFRTRYCTFVILPSLLLTAVVLLHCTILTPSLSIHSSTPPLLCSATHSTHLFSANMTCMNQFWWFSSLSSTLAFRFNSWNARVRIPHSINDKHTLRHSKFSFIVRRVIVVQSLRVRRSDEMSFYFSHSYDSALHVFTVLAFLLVTLNVYCISIADHRLYSKPLTPYNTSIGR